MGWLDRIEWATFAVLFHLLFAPVAAFCVVATVVILDLVLDGPKALTWVVALPLAGTMVYVLHRFAWRLCRRMFLSFGP